MIYKSCVPVVLMICGFCLFPVDAKAEKGGAVPGSSGGPAGFGQNCLTCHQENIGSGRVELLGVPTHYTVDTVYDLTVRIIDADQAGGGFEISVETGSGHIGTLLLLDTANTKYAGGDTNYVTHTLDGALDSIAGWSSNGGQFEYILGWRAPATAGEAVTIYVAALAIDNASAFFGDNNYETTVSFTSATAQVPTLSAWGLLSMALALTVTSTLVLRRRRRA